MLIFFMFVFFKIMANEKVLRLLNRTIEFSKRGDLLSILNLGPSSVFDDVLKNYYLLSKYIHPDRNPPEYRDLATTAFSALNNAKETLSNPAIFAGELEKRCLEQKRQQSPSSSFRQPTTITVKRTFVVMSPAVPVFKQRIVDAQIRKRIVLFSPGGFFSGSK